MLDKLRKKTLFLEKNDPRKYELIKTILENDNCFYEMNVDISLSILKSLDLSDKEAEKIYLYLIKKDKCDL